MFFESADKNPLINVYLKFREQKCFQDVTKYKFFDHFDFFVTL